ncbi:MAG: hypothetical protein LBD20_05245 [Spirochaetaceae bacterium]|jgi:hypothetical protein|nr:hypothetical protein [Spirochaetaceae bacterium]
MSKTTGDVMWQKTFNGAGNFFPYSAAEDALGSAYVCGYWEQDAESGKVYIAKINT